MNASYKRFWEPNYPLVLGLSLATNALATAITYPLNFIKTVIQFRSTGVGLRGYQGASMGYNPNKILRQMHTLGGGFAQFYGGFVSHFTGRMIYLTIRNTIYYSLYQTQKPNKPTNDITIKSKMILGAIAGGIAGFITSPLELISVRQILDTQIRPQWRRNYNSIGDSIAGLKGIGQLWKGASANAIKHIILNVCLTGPYDYAHERLWVVFGDYGFVRPLSLAFACAVGTAASLPFDYVKTRLMQMHQDPLRNRVNTIGVVGTLCSVFATEGTIWAPWTGFMTAFCQNLIIMGLIVGITNGVTKSIKKNKNLEHWQI